MARYILQRTVQAVVAMWVVVTITFGLMHLLPGDPFLGERVSPQVHELMLRKYHLDEPLWNQYVSYLGGIVRGDFGVSLRQTSRPVSDMLVEGFSVSAVLGAEALLFGVLCGVGLGIMAARHHNTGRDYAAILTSLIFISVPNFVVAALLQYFVGVRLGWLPVARWEGFAFTIMPALALGATLMASKARLMRSSMLDVMSQDYIKTARAKGMSPRRVVWGHGVRNAILPVVTTLGPQVAAIVTGTFVIEQIFGVPGLGKHFVDSVNVRDYTVIMGTTIFYAAFLIFLNLLVDISYGFIDPRIRVSAAKE